jgi:hypothetical protein
MREFDVTFRLRVKPGTRYLFDDTIEIEGGRIRVEAKDGKICGRIVIFLEREDYDLARKEAVERLERLTSMLMLIFGEGLAVDDVSVERKPVIKGTRRVKVTVFDAGTVKDRGLREVKLSKVSLHEIGIKLEELLKELDGWGEKSKDLLRAVRWWGKGSLEKDKVDAFLDYYISFEILAYIKNYKQCEDWVKRFSERYSITYKPDRRTAINDIRAGMLHEPGPIQKDEAERLANQYADRFGEELLKAIKKIIEEGP